MKKTLKYKNKKAIYLEFESNVKEVNSKMLLKILNSSKKKNMNIRYCLHNKRNDKQQEMVICQKQKLFFPPKKNTKSDQTFLILYGKLLIIIFNSQGKIIKKIILSKNNKIMARVKKNIYHCDIPLTNYSIHLETKNSIFDKNLNKFAKFDFNRDKMLKNLKKFSISS